MRGDHLCINPLPVQTTNACVMAVEDMRCTKFEECDSKYSNSVYGPSRRAKQKSQNVRL